MIARSAGLDAARPGEIGRDDAAEAALARCAAEQRTVVHRLETELLIVVVEQRLDFGERRAGFGRKHELGRLVERHTGQRGEVERQIGLTRPADGALRSAPGHFERLAVLDRPAHGLLGVLAVARLDRVNHRYSAARAAGVCAKPGMMSRAKRRNWSRPPATVSRMYSTPAPASASSIAAISSGVPNNAFSSVAPVLSA